MKKHVKLHKVLISIFIFLLLLSFSYAEEESRVLFISSYNPSFPTFFKQIEGIKSVLDEDKYVLDIEFMDSKRFFTDENLNNFYKLLEYKLSNQEKYDAVIVSDDNAYNFILKYQNQMFNKTPIVFLGVNDIDKALEANNNPYITGVVERISLKETIEAALSMNKNSEKVISLIDSTVTGQNDFKKFNTVSKEFDNIVFETISLAQYDTKGFIQELKNIEKDDTVLLLSAYKDKTGKVLSFEEGLSLVLEHTKAPIYHLWPHGIGKGLIGGKTICHREQGRVAATLVKDILNGTAVESIPVILESPNKFIFDNNVLLKYNLNNLPKDSILINKEINFFEKYKSIVLTVCGVFIVMLFLIIRLIINIEKRKKMEMKLVNRNDELTALYEELYASEEELKSQYFKLDENRKEILRSKERYQLVFEASNENLWEYNFASNSFYCSPGLMELLGDSFDYCNPTIDLFLNLIHKDDYFKFKTVFKNLVSGKIDRVSHEYRFLDQYGNYRWLYIKGKSLNDDAGNPKFIAGSCSDVNEKKTHEQRIRKLAYYDPLTNLPNRVLLNKVLEKEIDKNDFTSVKGAIFFIDVDNFKVINDTLGHVLGDKILVEISNRFKDIAEKNNFVARLGGDEFVLLLKDIYSINEISHIANKIISIFESSFLIEEKEFYLTVSIGITIYPQDGHSVTELLKNADTAMYKAKSLGKNQYVYFAKEMNEKIFRKMHLQNRLRNAIECNELTLYYQPKVNLKSNEIIGHEALIRWINPEHGFIPPNEFISIAEESGLIFKLDTWVFEQACEFSKRINKKSDRIINVSVNVSPVELMNANYISNIGKILKKTEVDPKLIGIEITETALMQSFESNKRILNELKNLGIQISLDDFGTGYSSLNYLRKLPIDVLKIDKSFVDDMESDEDARTIIQSIIDIAHNLDLQVIAEGVETVEQKNALAEYKCDQIQGFLISRPLPEEELSKITSKK
ncbi:ABC transporter substrate binding protein [Wukongibacter baidiensis]|uniref:ABC transporter substrate binding protein n=1 Tax=Wukongibacter baidiensis TaxID=1723361 RepID=UPI003D7F54D5